MHDKEIGRIRRKLLVDTYHIHAMHSAELTMRGGGDEHIHIAIGFLLYSIRVAPFPLPPCALFFQTDEIFGRTFRELIAGNMRVDITHMKILRG